MSPEDREDHDPGDEDRRPIFGRKRPRKKAPCPLCGELRTVRVDGQIINHRCGW